MGIFDRCAVAAVKATDVVMGYTATWGVYTATVKYKDMAGEQKLGDVKYGIDHWEIEFTDSDFPGLKTSINNQVKELITVNVRGVNMQFFGTTANAKSDGLCTVVRMKQKTVG